MLTANCKFSTARVPSRHGNPFATCWTKPGAIAFRFAAGESADGLVAKLAAQNGWGQIRGPHGSGKSTLLAALQPLLAAAGRRASTITLRNGQRRLPREYLRHALSLPNALVVVDGYEQLTWRSRAWLRWRIRRAGAGLLVTAHAAAGLPLLVELVPDVELVRQLVAMLSERVPTLVTAADVAASHAVHGSNVREMLFDLYERHERAARIGANRGHALRVTATASPAYDD